MIDDFLTAKALLDKAQAFADTHSYRLSIQDVKFEPVTSETYLKETFLANKTDPLGLAANSSDEQKPIYQIDIFTPKGKGGKWSGLNISNLLKDEFIRASFIVNTAEQKVIISNVSAQKMPPNQTHNWNMVEIELVVLASN